MTEITLEDLQELGRLLKDVKCRSMTEQEIENFGVIPEGATRYETLKSYQAACKKLKNVAYEAGSNPNEGLFWTLEK